MKPLLSIAPLLLWSGSALAINVLSVGNPGGEHASLDAYAAGDLTGSYEHVTETDFNAMSLTTLMSYDVIIVQWNSEPLDLDWDTKMSTFVDAGGGFWHEDPNSMGDYGSMASASAPGCSPGVLVDTVPGLTDGITNDFVNCHMVFDSWASYMNPLLDDGGQITMLWGEYGSGRVILSGPDHDWHGVKGASGAQGNQYNFMLNIVNWVSDGCDDSTFYADADGDGYGDASATTMACEAPAGYVADSSDCDDADSAVNPGASEVCDGIDNNCDAVIDPDDSADALTWYDDYDGDGFGDPDLFYSTVACAAPSGYVADSSDCNDVDSSINPDAIEVCDGVDNNCDGAVDPDDSADATTWYEDFDGDGYGDPDPIWSTVSCTMPSGYTSFADATDCNDVNAGISPGADEVCDGIDNNCDDVIDPPSSVDAATFYADADGDTYGDAGITELACAASDGFVADATDCDDTEAAINPGAAEVCDGIDNNCDGSVDPDDSVDAATWYSDGDSDGYGDSLVTYVSCDGGDGWVAASGDCDDADAGINPDAREVCDDADNDCDGTVDGPDSVDALTFYPDNDGDGFGLETVEEICEDAVVDCDTGDAGDDTGDCFEEVCTDVSSALTECAAPDGYVDDNTDCDDEDADVYPGAPGLDEDCELLEDTGDAGDDTGDAGDDTGDAGDDDGDDGDTGTDVDDDSDKLDVEECGCATGSLTGSSPWLAVLALVGLARRRQPRA